RFRGDTGSLSAPDEDTIAPVLAKALQELREKPREKARERTKELTEEEKRKIEQEQLRQEQQLEDEIRRSIPRRCPSMEELARGYDNDEPVSVEELEEALAGVQKLDPPGRGGRDLPEGLLVQLAPDTPHRDVLRVLILNHLEDIQHNRLPAIQKKTHFDLATIKEAIERLKHLNPRPGSQYIAENIPYVVPDIQVELDEVTGEY